VQTTIVEVSCQQAATAITTTTTGEAAVTTATTQRQHVHLRFLKEQQSSPFLGHGAWGKEHAATHLALGNLEENFCGELNYHT